MFPSPFRESAAFDPVLWEATARVAAEESAVEGIDLTFAPMIESRGIRAGLVRSKGRVKTL